MLKHLLRIAVTCCIIYGFLFAALESTKCKRADGADSIPNDLNEGKESDTSSTCRSQNTSDEGTSFELHPIIDLVITYVNGSEETFQAKLKLAKEKAKNLQADSSSRNRFEDRDDLRFLLRSVEKYGGIFHRIFLVVADERQIPRWLNASGDDRLSVVFHRDIWRDSAELPTFNSLSIEANLHRISGLADLYVYCNDDVAFVAPATHSDFFQISQSAKGDAFVTSFTARPTSLLLQQGAEKDIHFVGPAVKSRDLILSDDVCGRGRLTKALRLLHTSTQHAPHAFIRSVLERAENISIVREAFARTSRSRFRSGEEISVAHFFAAYAHCARKIRAIGANENEVIFIQLDEGTEKFESEYEATVNSLIANAGRIFNPSYAPHPKYVCVNDDTSAEPTNFGRSLARVVNLWRQMLFPTKSRFEI